MEKKLMNDFVYHAPKTLPEVFEILDKYPDTSCVIGGGTDFIPKMKAKLVTPDHVIDLKAVSSLHYLTYNENDGLWIGPAVTLRETETNAIVIEKYPVLAEGIHSMANTQVRNSGTVAGNICNALPSADTAPALEVLNAEVKISSSFGDRIVPVTEFFTGVCRNALKPGEIVTGIHIPAPDSYASMHYKKNSIRMALDLAVVGVATYFVLDSNKVVQDARISLGAVAIVPRRAYAAEKLLIGHALTEESIEAAAKEAAEAECSPITDIRATAEYRRKLVYLSIRDALHGAAAEV